MNSSTDRKALLKEKTDRYIAEMEASGAGVNYNNVTTDRLLILEALNDWSGRLLAEGGDLKLTYECDDPACATPYEMDALIDRMHARPVLFYPVSGFSLADDDGLRFHRTLSSYRLMPHAGGSRTDAIGIAESSHIQDVDAAMNLWSLCATEDCLAYLKYQMAEHGLYFGDDELSATRQIIASALLTNFSIGQVWNAIWRSVRDAAALSARPYYNVTKAAKTIPKKIDKVLTQHAGERGGFPSYDRLASLPMGAVLTLLMNRFGIEDDSPGPEVHSKFSSDAALAPKHPKPDEGRVLVQGTLFFAHEITPFDRLVLSCFQDLQTDTPEPEWDDEHVIGRIFFKLDDVYAFDGETFCRSFLAEQGVLPTPEDLARHAAAAKARQDAGSENEDLSGRRDAEREALLKAGIKPDDLTAFYWACHYPATVYDVVRALRIFPVAHGLQAVRVGDVQVYDEYFQYSDGFFTAGGFSMSFPEENLAPNYCDIDLLDAALNGKIDRLADLVTTAVLGSVGVTDPDTRRQLLREVGQRILAHANPDATDRGNDSARP